MTLEDWKKQAAYIQANLTDEIIEKAIALLPPKANELSGEKNRTYLKISKR